MFSVSVLLCTFPTFKSIGKLWEWVGDMTMIYFSCSKAVWSDVKILLPVSRFQHSGWYCHLWCPQTSTVGLKVVFFLMLKLIKVTFLMYDSCKDFKSDCVTMHRDPGPLSAERSSQCCSTIIFYCCAASHLSLRGATPCSGGTCEPAHSFPNTHTCRDKFNFSPSACELVIGNTRQEAAKVLKVEDELSVENKFPFFALKPSQEDDDQWKLWVLFD